MINPCPSSARSNRHRWDPSSLSLEQRKCRYCGALGKVDKQGVVQFVGGFHIESVHISLKVGP